VLNLLLLLLLQSALQNGHKIKREKIKIIYSNNKKIDLNANNLAKGRYFEKLEGVSREVV
jgi:hypothetical protein